MCEKFEKFFRIESRVAHIAREKFFSEKLPKLTGNFWAQIFKLWV
jgi:hypothetical protein